MLHRNDHEARAGQPDALRLGVASRWRKATPRRRASIALVGAAVIAMLATLT